MKINTDLLQIVFTTAAFGLILYLSHIFADEPASRFNPGNLPDLAETSREHLSTKATRQPAKQAARQEPANVIHAAGSDAIH